MDSILMSLFRAAIEGKKDTAFQDVVDSIYAKRYGPGFTSVKQKRDKGCDGIVGNKKIIAVYAPEKPNLKDFKKKTDEDFGKYKKNWSSTHPEWEYVYNGEYTALMVQYLNALKPDCCKVDINRILDIIEELPHFKRRDLATELSINEQFIINDALRSVIEDLLKLSEQCIENLKPHQTPPYIEDKIRLNYSEGEVDDALKEYECAVNYFGELRDILRAYKDFEVGALKTKLVESYSKLVGSFKERFNVLVEQFSERNKNDDYYVFFVRVVLIYFFESCLIGKRPESEK